MNILEIALSLALFSLCPQVETWKAIVPLHSTRADVERLLGPPVRPCKEGCTYDTKSEGVFVRYSGEPCEKGEANRWRVPRDTVISLSVYPSLKPNLSDLKLDRKRFKKTKDPELHGYYTYENQKDGVAYEVSDRGVVLGVEWFGASKDAEALRCGSVSDPGSTKNTPIRVLMERKEWKGLTPMHSTRADVEQLLGPQLRKRSQPRRAP
jgi:hypothetical protein